LFKVVKGEVYFFVWQTNALVKRRSRFQVTFSGRV